MKTSTNQSRVQNHNVTLALAFMLTILAYLIAINGPFLYDDYNQITGREELHHLFSNLRAVIFCNQRQIRLWQNLSFALNWAISPNRTWSFKLFNLMLHLANGTLLYLWLKRCLSDKAYLAPLTAAIFLILPLQAQSVTYVMGRVSLLQGFFYLLSLYWFSKYSLKRPVALFIILAASLFAKETCVFIAPLLLLYHVSFQRKGQKTGLKEIDWRRWAPFLATPLLLIPIYLVLKDPVSMYAKSTGFHLFRPFSGYVFAQLYFQFFYLVLFLNPKLQSIAHYIPIITPLHSAMAIAGGGLFLGSLFFAFSRFRKFPRTSFFILFFFIIYLPTGSVFQMINPFAEYRLYLSNVSLCLALAWLLSELGIRLAKRIGAPSPKVGVPLFAILLLSIFTCRSVLTWRDGVAVYQQAVAQYPYKGELFIELGHQFYMQNNLRLAFFNFQTARYLSRSLSESLSLDYYRTAVMAYQKGDYQYAKSIVVIMSLDPNHPQFPPQYYELKARLETLQHDSVLQHNHQT